MNIGVFGATGFIGSYLVNDLGQHHLVKGYSSSVEDSSKKITKGRYDSRDSIDQFTKNLDVVVFAAGVVNPRASQLEDQAIIDDSVKNLETCLELFFSNNHNGLFIFLSSAGALYPNSSICNHDETSVLSPLGFYGKLKYNQEKLIANKFSNNNIIILRPSNIFGNPLKKNKMTGVIDRLIASRFTGEVVNIFENLQLERDYLYIGDLGAAIQKIVITESFTKRKGIFIYNLSSHEMKTLNEIMLKIQEYFTIGNSKICFTNINESPSCLKINSSKFRNETGWSPAYSFERALEEIKTNVENAGIEGKYV